MKLKIPKTESAPQQSNIILEINANIKEILEEILNIQSEIINNKNEKKVKEILGKADLVILECHTTDKFKISKNGNFSRLVYEYQRLNLRYESYQISQQIKNVNEEYVDIKKSQDEIKNETNNLVYNILGFIASFSIVSAAVSAIDKISSISGILLFMAFTAFILLTTLIGLYNFYKNNDKCKNKLQNNYFLWKMMIVIVILLVMYRGITYIKENRQEIFESIGRGIGQVVNLKINNNEEN